MVSPFVAGGVFDRTWFEHRCMRIPTRIVAVHDHTHGFTSTLRGAGRDSNPGPTLRWSLDPVRNSRYPAESSRSGRSSGAARFRGTGVDCRRLRSLRITCGSPYSSVIWRCPSRPPERAFGVTHQDLTSCPPASLLATSSCAERESWFRQGQGEPRTEGQQAGYAWTTFRGTPRLSKSMASAATCSPRR